MTTCIWRITGIDRGMKDHGAICEIPYTILSLLFALGWCFFIEIYDGVDVVPVDLGLWQHAWIDWAFSWITSDCETFLLA